MRYKEPYTLYLRVFDNGRKVFYYRAYNEQRKHVAYSTGKKKIFLAKEYCKNLLKTGSLSPKTIDKSLLFKDYAFELLESRNLFILSK